MNRLPFLIIFIFFLSVNVVWGQFPDSLVKPPFPSNPSIGTGSAVCGSDLLLLGQRKSSAFLKREENMNKEIANAVRLLSNDSVVLPVVFHILADDPYAIPDQTILDGLKELNDAFAMRGPWSASIGVDTKIRFCLAQKDPDGGNTTGITRVVTHWGNHVNTPAEDARMKATAQWDPARYINIWYVRSIEWEIIAEFSCGVWTRLRAGGYATFPPGGGESDGIVITAFGNLIAHEMGHYLGLYHTFEGYCNNFNCLLNGDRVCDTPPDGSYLPSACGSPSNSCDTDTLSNYSNGHFTTDVKDPIENIMDYGFDACKTTFTQGQADRMHNAIQTQRKGLLEPKCDKPCSDMVFASFKRNKAYPKPGDMVEFLNTSAGAVTFQWFVDGVQVSTDPNLQYLFSQAGKFKVTLKAFKDNSCYGSFSEYVIVDCGVVARFYLNKHTIASREIIFQDTIKFTNNSLAATDYKWLMSNDKGMAEQVVSTDKDLTYMFAIPANYTIRLIATDGQCTDTTQPYLLSVADPTPDGSIFVTNVHCYEHTKIRVSFFICNNSYDTIPAGTPVSFYSSDPRLPGAQKVGGTFTMPNRLVGLCCTSTFVFIVDVGMPGLNELWASFNDNGTTLPLVMPNTGMEEKDYTNNLRVIKNFQLKATPVPASAILEPGDTIKLGVVAGPTTITGYLWKPNDRLSCTQCQYPEYVADTSKTITKEVMVTSIYNCYDTAYVQILVPPYNDYSIIIDSADCTNTDSLRVHFTLFNDFRLGILPKGLTVRFYDGDPSLAGAKPLLPAFTLTDTILNKDEHFSMNIQGRSNGPLYAVVNDGSGIPPITLPNSNIEEKNFSNNTSIYNYARLDVTTIPLVGLIEPGDTIMLEANAGPGTVKGFTWNPNYNLSCSVCQYPDLYADTTTTKQVIAENLFGCRDTAYLQVNIPPADDFTIGIDEAACAANDSMFVGFTITNLFRRGYLPKGLTIRFYNGDPQQAGAVELRPPFMLPQDYLVKTESFSTIIKNSTTGKLYAVVNDSGTTTPLVLPNGKRLEKDYANNIVQVNYRPDTLELSPQDTTIMRGASFNAGILNPPLFNPGATTWATGPGYTLSCNPCSNPLIRATHPSVIAVTSPNRYGCLLKGSLEINILPPDFTISINQTACLNNQSTSVNFTICMNNGYDTVWNGIPVTFYDGDPSTATANILQTVFLTPAKIPGNCAAYVHNITTPSINALFARVNDKGLGSTPGADIIYDETNSVNNIAEAFGFKRFSVMADPSDTTIERSTPIQIVTTAEGGNLQAARWDPNPFLSCTNCLNPIIIPAHTDHYIVTGKNENQCTDTAMITIRTVTIGDLYIPTAFTPNNDRLNEVFYVMGSERVITLKDFIIYTRWGDKVFEAHNIPANDPMFGWNGTDKGVKSQPGVYVYQVNAQMADGKYEFRKGTVTLIR